MVSAVEADAEASRLGACVGVGLSGASDVLDALEVGVCEDRIVERQQRGALKPSGQRCDEAVRAMLTHIEHNTKDTCARVIGILHHLLE